MYNGETDQINTCIGCNQGCLDHVFVGRVATCLVNPKAGHELEIKEMENRKRTKQNIAVVGAGPSGMAFAVTAAELGHNVTLMDAGESIGGQFHMAKQIPGKEEFYETLRYFTTMITKKLKESITLKLNTKVTANDLLSGGKKYDRIVIATGVKPRTPPIPGIEHPNVLTYIQVLKEKVKVGKKVAIIGAGGIGFDVAEFLLHENQKVHGSNSTSDSPAKDMKPSDFFDYWGIDPTNTKRGGLVSSPKHDSTQKRQILLLQRKQGKLGANLGKTTGWIHRTQLKKGDTEMIGGCQYEKIDEEGNLHIVVSKKEIKSGKYSSEKRVLEVDNIVICAGQESLFNLETELNQLKEEAIHSSSMKVFRIGGAYQAGELDAKRAIDMGVRLAYDIDLKDPKVFDESKRVKDDEERIIELFSKLMGR